MKVIYSHSLMMQLLQNLLRSFLGVCHMKLDKIGKFLSAILVRTDVLLRETE